MKIYQLTSCRLLVDDHEMEISHAIRGDDHMINSFKQAQIWGDGYGLGGSKFCSSLPLIHSEQGKKLSKRDHVSTLRIMGKLELFQML